MKNTVIRLLPLICVYGLAGPLTASAEPQDAQPAAQTSATPADSASANKTATDKASADKPASTTASTDAKPTKIVLDDNTVTDAQVKQILGMGYKPESRQNEVRYCRREPVLGTRFDSKICRSAQQILEMQRNSQEWTENAQRAMKTQAGR